MSEKQTEAQRLAELLEACGILKAAAELRRLDAENEALLIYAECFRFWVRKAAQNPLTLEQIEAIDDEVMKSPRGYCVKFARAIEAAHGIK